MISHLIVFSSLFLGILFTGLYLLRPEFRARVEQPKYAFLQQLARYDKGVGSGQTIAQRLDDLDDDSDKQDKIGISSETAEK